MALKCRSFTCIHNDTEGKCFANIIKVGGNRAKTTGETTCNSYVKKETDFAVEFASEFIAKNPNPATNENISCEAMNCSYNCDCDCSAKHVKIEAMNSSCETFKC